jgi:hypothetical protein
VDRITAFLFHGGGHENPATLEASASKSFQGSVLVGMGFTFDDTDKKGVASSIADMNRLIAKDSRNNDRIFPYVGGQEINASPTHSHHRYVINFGEMSEAEARRWPDLMAIVEDKVRTERDAALAKSWSKDKEKRATFWWQFNRSAKELYEATAGLDRVLAVTRLQHFWSTSFLPAGSVFAESLIIFPLDTHAAFCALQSRPHGLWARFFGSSMKDDLRYTPSDCFETFPFPKNWETDPTLEDAGKTYYEFRAEMMVRNDEGLTKTYNRFHDPDNNEPDIKKLRELHAAMDRAVLNAYGWDDISTDCEFLLDYEIDEETWGKKKKPYRYRWPEAVHDEVLARLLDLNQKRYTEEVAAGLHDKKGKKKATKKTKPKAAPASHATLPLFASMNPTEES